LIVILTDHPTTCKGVFCSARSQYQDGLSQGTQKCCFQSRLATYGQMMMTKAASSGNHIVTALCTNSIALAGPKPVARRVGSVPLAVHIAQASYSVIEKFPFRIHTVRTDRGHEWQSHFHWHVGVKGIRHVYVKPHPLQLTGNVEGSHRSVQEQFSHLLTHTDFCFCDNSAETPCWIDPCNGKKPPRGLYLFADSTLLWASPNPSGNSAPYDGQSQPAFSTAFPSLAMG